MTLPVEHAAPHPYETDFPWRTAALVATLIAAAELLVLVVLGVIALAPSGHAASAAPARARAHARVKPRAIAPPKHRLLAPAQTRVLVLNGNGLSGAAASESQRVRSAGYRVSGVGNAQRMAGGPSVVMYRPQFRTEGLRLARALGVPVVGPLDGLLVSGLHGAHLVVVVGG